MLKTIKFLTFSKSYLKESRFSLLKTGDQVRSRIKESKILNLFQQQQKNDTKLVFRTI